MWTTMNDPERDDEYCIGDIVLLMNGPIKGTRITRIGTSKDVFEYMGFDEDGTEYAFHLDEVLDWIGFL